MATKEKPYRGVFKTVDGAFVGLDFYADNRGLALDHAGHLDAHPEFGILTVVRVNRIETIDETAGTFFAMGPR